MTPRGHALGRNVLVALGLWWCFTFLGSMVVWAWNSVVIYNRGFSGESGDVLRAALSMPGYIVAGVLVGLGAARFIESPRVMQWAAGLGALIALADVRSWGGMKYRGRPPAEAGVVALVIVASVVLGCWLGGRSKSAWPGRGQVA